MTRIDDAMLQESQVTLSKLVREQTDDPGKIYVQLWLKSGENAWSGLLKVTQARELGKRLIAAAEQVEAELHDAAQERKRAFLTAD